MSTNFSPCFHPFEAPVTSSSPVQILGIRKNQRISLGFLSRCLKNDGKIWVQAQNITGTV
jgi:hypothetical protein